MLLLLLLLLRELLRKSGARGLRRNTATSHPLHLARPAISTLHAEASSALLLLLLLLKLLLLLLLLLKLLLLLLELQLLLLLLLLLLLGMQKELFGTDVNSSALVATVALLRAPRRWHGTSRVRTCRLLLTDRCRMLRRTAHLVLLTTTLPLRMKLLLLLLLLLLMLGGRPAARGSREALSATGRCGRNRVRTLLGSTTSLCLPRRRRLRAHLRLLGAARRLRKGRCPAAVHETTSATCSGSSSPALRVTYAASVAWSGRFATLLLGLPCALPFLLVLLLLALFLAGCPRQRPFALASVHCVCCPRERFVDVRIVRVGKKPLNGRLHAFAVATHQSFLGAVPRETHALEGGYVGLAWCGTRRRGGTRCCRTPGAPVACAPCAPRRVGSLARLALATGAAAAAAAGGIARLAGLKLLPAEESHTKSPRMNRSTKDRTKYIKNELVEESAGGWEK